MICDERRETDSYFSSVAVQIIIGLVKPKFEILLRKTHYPKFFLLYSCAQLNVCSLNTLL